MNPGFVELAGVFDARTAQIQQDAIVEILEGGAVGANSGAAEQVAVLELPCVGGVDAAGPQRRTVSAEIGRGGAGCGLEVLGCVELDHAVRRERERPIRRRQDRSSPGE